MRNQIEIKFIDENLYTIQNKNGQEIFATIIYRKGYWILENSNNAYLEVNNTKIKDKIILEKRDVIKIQKCIFHWNDYIKEGNNQEIELKDLLSFHGRINRKNYRAIWLLAIGLGITVYFLPGLVVTYLESRRRYSLEKFDTIGNIQELGPYIHVPGFTLILSSMILFSIKRIRDTGKSISTLLIPLYNLKVLLFNESK